MQKGGSTVDEVDSGRCDNYIDSIKMMVAATIMAMQSGVLQVVINITIQQ